MSPDRHTTRLSLPPQLLPTDKYLSFLPLAHIFETMVEHAILSVGGSIGFYNGNIKKILDDILTLKPTIFVGVPVRTCKGSLTPD